MALIAKRKVGSTWRQAVAERAAERSVDERALLRFDALVAAGAAELDAAYRVLSEEDLLWSQPMPTDPPAPAVPSGTAGTAALGAPQTAGTAAEKPGA